VLQPSLPTYICSFASPCAAATATTNILPCIPSSTVLGSPVSSVLWSPRSTGVGAMVTQGDGSNCGASRSLPCDHVMSRSRTCLERPGTPRQPISPPLSSRPGVLSGSPQPPGGISPTALEHFASRLVAGLPAAVKSMLESDSNEQRVELLAETLNTIHGSGADAVHQLCHSPQLAVVAKQLFPSQAFDAKTTSESIGRWRSQPALLQPDQLQSRPSTLSGHHNRLQSDVHLPLPSSQNVMRSLGQLGHAPAHRLEAEAAGQYRWVFCLERCLHTS